LRVLAPVVTLPPLIHRQFIPRLTVIAALLFAATCAHAQVKEEDIGAW